jgi:hypothetical protein
MARRLFRMRVRTTRSKLGVWKHLPSHATVTGDIAVAMRARVDAYPVADRFGKPSERGQTEAFRAGPCRTWGSGFPSSDVNGWK